MLPFASQKRVRKPGIGPGSQPWQGRILPLNYFRICFNLGFISLKD